MTGVEPAEKVATATGIFQSNFVGLSAGRLALASLIGSAPLPPAVAELRCLCVGREAAPAGPRDPLFQTDRSGFTWGSLRVDMATRGGFCTLVHLHVALRFWSQPHSTPSPMQEKHPGREAQLFISWLPFPALHQLFSSWSALCVWLR